jgi:uncharacterized membrane protein YdjX (TVP38/TMEM64 family)
MSTPTATAKRGRNSLKAGSWLLLVVALVALIVLVRGQNIGGWLQDALTWVRGLGWWGPVIFVLLYIAACVLLIPGSVLTLGAGILYGVVGGTALVSVASTLGATASFLVGRYLARDWVSSKLARQEKFRRLDEAVGREGWRIVGLLRLSPIFPFNLLNYAFGLTRVRLRDYVLASWIGMLPGTVLYVYLGSLLGEVANVGHGVKTPWPAKVAFGVVTLAITWYLARVARKALAARLPDAPAPPP